MNKYNIVLKQPQADKLKKWLTESRIEFEPSGYGEGVYFNIIATEAQARAINRAIERLYKNVKG